MVNSVKHTLATGLLLACGGASCQNTNTSYYTSYGGSPPVYPSPNATGLGWEAAFERASDFVSLMTLEEKVRLLTGTTGPCVGNIGPIYRLGFNGLCLQDGPLAIRQTDFASVFPAGITVAAAWDRSLARERARQLAVEFREKGAHVALQPVAGPLGRVALGGRNWEGFSPDPYLTGELFTESIIGTEEMGVQATAKHYIANEQEEQRNPTTNRRTNQTIEAVSSNVDDRTLHELYLWPFAQGIRAGVSSIMCSYNRINGSYGCQNSKLLNGVLKEELGFQGYVMSDWWATHAGPATIHAGLDMDMPGTIRGGNRSYFGANLTAAATNGSVPVERLDDMARRILTPYFRLGQDQNYPGIDPSQRDIPGVVSGPYVYNFTYNQEASVDVRFHHANLIREAGAAGIVLLKNTNQTLPLKTPRRINVFGNDAGHLINSLYVRQQSEFGVLPVGGGSGTGRLTYVVTPIDAIERKAAESNALVQFTQNNTLINVQGVSSNLAYPRPDVCLVFINTWAAEGYDRQSLDFDFNGTALVSRVADGCANTIVVSHAAGLNTMPFADHPNVTAILAAHLGGQEVGNSIVDVLWGDVNPSGHLPYTIARETSDYDYAPLTNSSELLNTTDPYAWQSDFNEGVLLDYRHFDYYNLSVQYPFGYGLSYTTFSVSDVTVNATSAVLSALPPAAETVPGGNPHLWDTVATISTIVTNTGDVAGNAVPQLYLALPSLSGTPSDFLEPKRILRGFSKEYLQPDQSCKIDFPILRRDISAWDVVAQQWRIAGPGAITAHVGFSSRDLDAQASFDPLSGSPEGYKH